MSAHRSSLPSSSKKRKASTNAGQSDDQTVTSIKELEAQPSISIPEGESLNKLTNLVQLALDASDANHVLKAVYALYRVFVTIIKKGMMNSKGAEEAEQARTVRAWLWEHMNQYAEFMGGLLQDEEALLRPQFHNNHFHEIIIALRKCPRPSGRSSRKKQKAGDTGEGLLTEDVHNIFLNTWLDVHDDIRWFFLREAGLLLANPEFPSVPITVLSLLKKLSTFPMDGT